MARQKTLPEPSAVTDAYSRPPPPTHPNTPTTEHQDNHSLFAACAGANRAQTQCYILVPSEGQEFPPARPNYDLIQKK